MTRYTTLQIIAYFHEHNSGGTRTSADICRPSCITTTLLEQRLIICGNNTIEVIEQISVATAEI